MRSRRTGRQRRSKQLSAGTKFAKEREREKERGKGSEDTAKAKARARARARARPKAKARAKTGIKTKLVYTQFRKPCYWCTRKNREREDLLKTIEEERAKAKQEVQYVASRNLQ